MGIEEIGDELLKQAASASTIEEKTAALTALKAAADAKNAMSAGNTERRQDDLDSQRTWTTFWAMILVPIASLLTLGSSFYFGSQQTIAAQHQAEDTEWRTLLSSMESSTGSVYSDITIAPRLRSFERSKNYAEEAKDIASNLMGRYSDPAGFQELYKYVFDYSVGPADFARLWRISEQLNDSKESIEQKCSQNIPDADDSDTHDLKYCGERPDDATFAQEIQRYTDRMKKNTRVTEFLSEMPSDRTTLDNLGTESTFLGDKVSTLLKEYYGVKSRGQRPGLSMDNGYLSGSDFSELDFTGFDISETVFESVSLAGSELTPRKFAGVQFRASDWWDARTISPDLLLFAISRWNPYWSPVEDETFPIGAADYRAKLKALCRASAAKCPATAPFGTQEVSLS